MKKSTFIYICFFASSLSVLLISIVFLRRYLILHIASLVPATVWVAALYLGIAEQLNLPIYRHRHYHGIEHHIKYKKGYGAVFVSSEDEDAEEKNITKENLVETVKEYYKSENAKYGLNSDNEDDVLSSIIMYASSLILLLPVLFFGAVVKLVITVILMVVILSSISVIAGFKIRKEEKEQEALRKMERKKQEENEQSGNWKLKL